MCTFLSMWYEIRRPIIFVFTQTLFKWHDSIYSVINAVQIWSSTATKPKITVQKVMLNEPLPYLILKLFSVQLIPDPAGCTPDLAMGFLPSHGSDSQQNTSWDALWLWFRRNLQSCSMGNLCSQDKCSNSDSVRAELIVFSNFFFHDTRQRYPRNFNTFSTFIQTCCILACLACLAIKISTR